MEIKVLFKQLTESARPPVYQHDGDAGADIYSSEEVILLPGEARIIGTGFAIGLPVGWEAQIRSRSGLAAKSGVSVLNSPGTIDSGYRDEVRVILHNSSADLFTVSIGDRIAQMVFCPTHKAVFEYVDNFNGLDDRGGGFGSTGK